MECFLHFQYPQGRHGQIRKRGQTDCLPHLAARSGNNVAIQLFLRIREQIKALEKEARCLNKQIDEGEIIMFPEYPLPED